MVERKVGTVVYWRPLSPVLAIFRLMPEAGSSFPDYKAGQYIALRRDDCKLTRRIGTGPDGTPVYGPDLDEHGNQKRGPVTHSYSISSAPYETRQEDYLEFYVVLEKDTEGHPGRLTESIFHIGVEKDPKITYVNRITGDFTLDKRAAGFKHVVLVGTGTGLAPFAGMIKQLDYEAREGKKQDVDYTLLHTNRTFEELAYHERLTEIEKEQRFSFLYLPSVSRPSDRDWNDHGMAKGRANNVLRYIFGMPLKEEQDLEDAVARGEAATRYRQAIERTIRPVLPKHLSPGQLRDRFHPATTVILTCGNAYAMADVKYVADQNKIRFEKEDW